MMNSHGARKWKNSDTQSYREKTKTDLLIDISGEEFRTLLNVEMTPINLKKLKRDYVDDRARRRSAPRYPLRMKVLLVTPHQIFQTEIQNISRSGMLLKDFVPEEMLQTCFDIVLVNHDAVGKSKYLIFRGHMVGAPFRSGRVAFDAMKNSSEKELTEMLQDLTPC